MCRQVLYPDPNTGLATYSRLQASIVEYQAEFQRAIGAVRETLARIKAEAIRDEKEEEAIKAETERLGSTDSIRPRIEMARLAALGARRAAQQLELSQSLAAAEEQQRNLNIEVGRLVASIEREEGVTVGHDSDGNISVPVLLHRLDNEDVAVRTEDGDNEDTSET
ncbi:hypothetical protein M011DRAFT_466420 [Sporormia fimetaria CBS 119925]|uniref:Uncharacterized protein n=1 Tax=Sporormia fimetaria CBS 119925 TaxID=1340428 RepID=A0A6A6VDI5_9PLEO|nr:hypothetical protein M011DRAFT_466420 [Sporormia fimetaria CBS 119925]